jgi:2-polyprenyl-6-methoxyphenol hydroxylase-like FAD-dependent oxidoreductase
MAKATSTRRVPALIVGGGPVGLYASSLLSAYGVPSLLAERAANGKSHPRAHLINTRSMELLRELGVERQIREQTPPMDEWRHFRYCTSVLGTQIAAQDHMAGREWAALSEMTPSPMAHLSQPKLEAILRAEAERRALGGTELLSGYECVSFAQHGGGVTAQLRRVVSPAASASYSAAGTGADADAAPDALTVEADYLLACVGAHSRVRQALGGPPPMARGVAVSAVPAPPLVSSTAHPVAVAALSAPGVQIVQLTERPDGATQLIIVLGRATELPPATPPQRPMDAPFSSFLSAVTEPTSRHSAFDGSRSEDGQD